MLRLLRFLNPFRRGVRKWTIGFLFFLVASPFLARLYYKLGEVEHPDYRAQAEAILAPHWRSPKDSDVDATDGYELLRDALEAVRCADHMLAPWSDFSGPSALNFDPDQTTAERHGRHSPVAPPAESVAALEEAGFYAIAARASECAVVRPYSLWQLESDPEPTYWLNGEHRSLRLAARASPAKARLQLATGDVAGALATVSHGLALVRIALFGTGELDPAIARGFAWATMAQIGELARDESASSSFLEGLLKILAEDSPAPSSLEVAQVRHLHARAAVAWLFRTRPGAWLPVATPWSPFLVANESEQLAYLDERLTKAEACINQPRSTRPKFFVNEGDYYTYRFYRLSQIAGMMFPHYETIAHFGDVAETTRNGVRTLIAIELYQRSTGVYPDRLQDLVPLAFDALPKDPMSADGMFRYQRTDPSIEAHGRGYLLYSVGSDGVDNGGLISERGHEKAMSWLFLDESDYIFNHVPCDWETE